MWIRSQDKKQLVNANELYIATRSIGYCISTGKGNDLASYLSEEKAIKVLDMIQDFEIRHQANLLLAIYQESNDNAEENMVFQMPQDSEVEV
nr:MAG TPA: hypothetical protein [Caudoviricetes sp.]